MLGLKNSGNATKNTTDSRKQLSLLDITHIPEVYHFRWVGVAVFRQIFAVVSFLSYSLLWLFQNVTLSTSTTSLTCVSRQPSFFDPRDTRSQYTGTLSTSWNFWTYLHVPSSLHTSVVFTWLHLFHSWYNESSISHSKAEPYKFWILSFQFFSPILSTFSASFPPISEIKKKQITTFHQPLYFLEIKPP